jgi:Flp pilus assembly pilin Flp
MHQLFTTVNQFVSRDEGQDLMEYGLLMALIAVVAIAAVTSVGAAGQGFWQSIGSTWQSIAQNV